MRPWGHLGGMLGYLGPSWGELGANLGPSWGILGDLGVVLVPSWRHLGCLEAISGHVGANMVPTWGHPGVFFGHLGVFLGYLGLLGRICCQLRAFLGYLGPSWAYRGDVCACGGIDRLASSLSSSSPLSTLVIKNVQHHRP